MLLGTRLSKNCTLSSYTCAEACPLLELLNTLQYKHFASPYNGPSMFLCQFHDWGHTRLVSCFK